VAFYRQIRVAARASLACGVAVAVLGCAAPKAPAPRAEVIGPAGGAFAGNQGGAWEVLFAPATGDSAGPAAESRRDAALNLREPEPITALGMWPDAPRPHLGQTRRLFIPRRADDVLFIRERPPYRYRHWSWH
jgi:hypothetical protein